MAYVDIESDRANYRFIFTHHNFPVNPKLIPDSSTAILIEAVYTSPDTLYYLVTGRKLEYQHGKKIHLQSIKERVRELEIPLVLAEPTYTEKGYSVDEPDNFQGIYYQKCLQFIRNMALNQGGIQYGSAELKAYEILAKYFIGDKAWDKENLRGLLMAQRTFAFGEYQIEKGVDRPALIVSTGASHLNITEAFHLSQEERVNLIKSDPLITDVFKENLLPTIHYTQFIKNIDQKRRKWRCFRFQDKSLE